MANITTRLLRDSDLTWLNEPISYNPFSAQKLKRTMEGLKAKEAASSDVSSPESSLSAQPVAADTEDGLKPAHASSTVEEK